MKNSLLTRIIGFIFVITAIIGVSLFILAMVNIWQIKETVYESLTSSLNLADDTLSATADALTLIDEALINASINISTLENTILATSRAVGDTTPILDSVTSLADEDLPNTILTVQIALESAQSSAKLIESALSIITAIPFVPGDPYDPPVPLHEALGQASESLEPLHESMSEINDSLRTSRGNLILIQAELNIMARHINELNKTLYSAQSVLAQYQDVVSNIQDRLVSFESKIPTWLNLTAWTITIFLVWLSIIQFGLFMQGLDLIKRENN
ncbi:MAG: hypothetical protein MUO67_14410 [Anaerolineales bacterium]|nr:hypothetical protein [Anaerolineales bacterium]